MTALLLIILYSLVQAEPEKHLIAELDDPKAPFLSPPPVTTKKECTKIDLSENTGPVRDQTGGSCYAYAAMELLNYKQPIRYSAIHLALYNLRTKRGNIGIEKIPGFNGGLTTEVLLSGLNEGICPEEFAPSIRWNDINEGFLNAVTDYYRESKMIDLKTDCEKPLDSKDFIVNANQFFKNIRIRFALGAKENAWNIIHKKIPTFSRENFEKAYNNTDNTTDFVMEIIKLSCSDHLKKPYSNKSQVISHELRFYDYELQKYVYTHSNQKFLISKINQYLDQELPVGIDYYTQGLLDAGFIADHGSHASVVVGRVWRPAKKNVFQKEIIPESCYYIVKNSWGKDWTPPFESRAFPVKDKPGYFLVSEKDLMEHLYRIDLFKPETK